MGYSKYIHCFFFYLLLIGFSSTVKSQISYGGQPLPLEMGANARMNGSKTISFIEMPPFDINRALLRSEENHKNFKSLEFAHKFFVQINQQNSGIIFETVGLKVWRVGIRSRKAYSLNILFSKFNLPEGAKVFVYNSDQSIILGSYTHLNNSDLNLLPIQPISGEDLIVEYQEPLNAAFSGELEIGEVNHDFRGILRATEPRDPSQSCHPNLVCYPEDIIPGNGVVALIINGNTFCTAALVNNTANDGTPYFVTATHCLNNDYHPSFLANRRYDMVAGNIVAFFNYQSPICDTNTRGNVQMTLASADSVLISERHDISLLKFKQNPPLSYQPYFLGWNVSSSPSPSFHSIHHPNGGVKKVAIDNNNLAIGSFSNPKYNMEPNAHWAVLAWDVAATEGGSSGSPLLDKDKRIVGTLTGGESYCQGPKGPDLYASFYKAWNVTQSLGNPNSLKNYLDPHDIGLLQMDGFNPYKPYPITKSANFSYNDTIGLRLHNSIPLFATNNSMGYTEFAEEFYADIPTKINGVYITSAITSSISSLNIKIRLYNSNNNRPGIVVHEIPLNYSFSYYQSNGFHSGNRDMKYNVENYVAFDPPIEVKGKFYISYYDENKRSNGFAALNVKPRNVGTKEQATTWMKKSSGWFRSSENIEDPINTSLLIAPLVEGNGLKPPIPEPSEVIVKAFYDKETRRILIDATVDLLSWEVYNSLGQKIFEGSTNSSINRTSMAADFLSGVYIVRVKVKEKTEIIKVLVR